MAVARCVTSSEWGHKYGIHVQAGPSTFQCLPAPYLTCRCVGGVGLSVVCRMMCEDSSNWRGGMPDLLLWRPERGTRG